MQAPQAKVTRPVPLSAVVREFREVAFAQVDRWCQHAVLQTGPVCRKGCAACCHNVVTVSLIEAVVMVSSAEGRAAVGASVGRIRAQANRFLRKDPGTKLKPWRDGGNPCPFLSSADECAVYADRPFNCRTHLAAKPCQPGQDGNYYVDPSEATHRSLELVEAFSLEAGVPRVLAPLPVAVSMAVQFLAEGCAGLERTYPRVLLHPEQHLLFWAYLEL